MHEYNMFLLIPPLLSTIQLYVPLHHFYLPLLCSLNFLNSLSAFGTTNMYLDITSYTGAWASYQGSTASQGSWICLAWVAINDQDLFEISCVPPCPQTHTQFSSLLLYTYLNLINSLEFHLGTLALLVTCVYKAPIYYLTFTEDTHDSLHIYFN